MINSDLAVFSRRRDKLRASLKARKVDGYVTFDFSDAQYLTGFPSEGAFVLVSASGDFIFTPSLLASHVRAVVKDSMKVVEDRRLIKAMSKVVAKTKLKKVGFDGEKVTYSLFKALQLIPKVKWESISGFVLSQRVFKDAPEIEAIRYACRNTARSVQKCFASLTPGLTEQEVAHRLEGFFRDGGSPKPAFETIIAFGENAAYPHHVVGSKKLEEDMTVLMDVGSSMGGYKSDLTRTGFFGKISPRFQKIYDIVKDSQQAGIDAVRDGVSAGKVDFICREFIRKAGYGKFFIHGTGHGVGLDIHEPPRLGIGIKEILKEGMVVTVEPGIYLPGEFGVRIEDTLLVTKTGSEILTKA